MAPTAVVTPIRAFASKVLHRGRQAAYAVKDPAPSAHGSSSKTKTKTKRKKIQWRRIPLLQLLRLAHRAAVLCAALVYITCSIVAANDARHLLIESLRPYASQGMFVSRALKKQIGTTTLRESAFVTDFLQNDTRPRNATIYYNRTAMAFDACDDVISPRVAPIYTTAFLQSVYDALRRDAAYNLTFLASDVTELIAPLVDCTSWVVRGGDETMAELSFLTRSTHDADDVSVLTFVFLNQVYRVPASRRHGPAAVGTLTFINDLRVDHVDVHYLVSLGYPFEPFDFRVYEHTGMTDAGELVLEPTTRPGEAADDVAPVVHTGTRSGFYMLTESDQANIVTEHWVFPDDDPIATIAGSEWITKPSVHDSWAWVHFVHLAFALDHVSSLLVLLVVSYRSIVSGKLWLGDAFVAVSDVTLTRGAVVVLSWVVNGFWRVLEFCVSDANVLTEISKMTTFDGIMKADLLTIYLCLCGLLGVLCRERIDPVLALTCFFVGYNNRLAILCWFPSWTLAVEDVSYKLYYAGRVTPIEHQSLISPMRLWNSYKLTSLPARFIAMLMAPIFGTLTLILLYIVARKVHRRFYPDPLRAEKASDATTKSSHDARQSEPQQKSVLTLFEIATGAQLANKFGLLAEYDNCLYIKGMKFATADGIYSSGFVIVNKTYLLHARDVWVVLLMKLLRVRYTNVYMYEVRGSTVDQTARLVYPSTFAFTELLALNTNILS